MADGTIVVVGSGPAGIGAALVAAQSAATILVDEQPDPGGHLRWLQGARLGFEGTGQNRQSLSASEFTEDASSKLKEAGVDYRPGTSVWALLPGPTIAAYDSNQSCQLNPAAFIVATGAVDWTWPIQGWHLPGVLTADTLLTELRTHQSSDARRLGLIGDGVYARETVKAIEHAGGRVTFQTGEIASAHISGTDRVERLSDDQGGAEVDAVILALGRRPDPSLVLQARADSTFLRDALIEMPLVADDGATSLPGVFVTGEAAGASSASDALSHGRSVGRAAASFASGQPQSVPKHAPRVNPAYRNWPPPNDPGAIVCRDQMVTLETIQAAMERGAYDVNDLRRQTRAGMGITQGRDAMPVMAALLEQVYQEIDEKRLVGRVRPPVRPVPFGLALQQLGKG